MSQLISILSALLVLVPGVPITVFCLECLAAIGSRRSRPEAEPIASPRPTIAILLPAHDEALGISRTLANLTAQLHPEDRLVVIADNCSDNTAEIARSFGAIVLERFNDQQRGKGYALAHGLEYLQTQPPQVVVTVDADCVLSPGAIDKIAHLADSSQRPVQSKYLMATESAEQTNAKNAVSTLAFLIKNWVRPAGLAQLGYPCLLTGTGMAFPWPAIQQAPLATGNIVEDMQLGLDLAIAGYPPLFCAEAESLGYLPDQAQAAQTQRTRWEHGHLMTLIQQAPRLFKAALSQGRWDLLAIALDLAVPPLSLLVALWLFCFAIAAGLWVLFGVWAALVVLAIAGLLLVTAVLASWYTFAREQVSVQSLLSVPLYILWKIPIYFKFLARPQTQWIRTQRPSAPDQTEGTAADHNQAADPDQAPNADTQGSPTPASASEH